MLSAAQLALQLRSPRNCRYPGAIFKGRSARRSPDPPGLSSADHGEWRSLVAHPAGGRAAAGSNPVSPMNEKPAHAGFSRSWLPILPYQTSHERETAALSWRRARQDSDRSSESSLINALVRDDEAAPCGTPSLGQLILDRYRRDIGGDTGPNRR